MTNSHDGEKLSILKKDKPVKLERSYAYTFVGDWGQANFHRICGWLTQEFGDRSGPATRVSTRSIRGGGLEVLPLIEDGEAELGIATPAGLMKQALTGKEPFTSAMPHLRALAVLPQTDRMVLAIDPKYGIKTYDDLRRIKPALKITTAVNDGTNFIGFVADKFLEAHGLTEAELSSWGCEFIRFHRPDGCIRAVESGQADALLQEAIMGYWWANLIENERLVPIPAEADALKSLEQQINLGPRKLPAGYWMNLKEDLPALDFADFVIVVRDDLPEEVAYVLTLCMVEARGAIEAQYKHLTPERSPLSYPLDPRRMAQPSIPLHPGAERYFREAGYL